MTSFPEMKQPFLSLAAALFIPGTAGAIDYQKDVLPIMKEHCWECHSSDEKVKGNLDLKNLEEMRDYQIGKFNIIRPGNPEESSFLEKMKLEEKDKDFMPRSGSRLPEDKLAIIEKWIKNGAVIDAEKPAEKEKEWVKKFPATPTGSPGTPPGQNFLTWKSKDGRPLEASFLGLGPSKNSVKLLRKQDKIAFEVPFANLDPESVALAQQLAGAAQ